MQDTKDPNIPRGWAWRGLDRMRSTVSPQAGHLFAAEGEAVAGRSKALSRCKGLRSGWSGRKPMEVSGMGRCFVFRCLQWPTREKKGHSNQRNNQSMHGKAWAAWRLQTRVQVPRQGGRAMWERCLPRGYESRQGKTSNLHASSPSESRLAWKQTLQQNPKDKR